MKLVTGRQAARHRAGSLLTSIAAALLALQFSAPDAQALIVSNTTGTNVAPADDPGWNNVGRFTGSGAGTFIYLGNKKVLTAYHIGQGIVGDPTKPISFNGNSYNTVAGSGVRLKNPDNSYTDLMVFELATDPGLPTLKISQATPDNGDALVMIGEGLYRQSSQTYWDVNTSDPSNWVWSEVPMSGPWDYTGFKWSGSVGRRWGTNQMFDNQVDFNGLGAVKGFATSFVIGATAQEANAATGDSGGAVFFKNPDTNEWELSGVMIGTGFLVGLNHPPSSATIDGYSATLAADLSVYRSQILALVPEPATMILGLAAVPALFMWTRRRRKTR